jgi:FkbM family methyltransferase
MLISSFAKRIRGRLIRKAPVRIGASQFRIPLLGALGEENLKVHREAWLDAYLAYAIRQEGMLFLDVGVNVGQTLLKVQALRRRVAYVGFEANVTCAAYAVMLIEMNRFSDCVVVPCALSSAIDFAELQMSDAGDPSASIVHGYRNPGFYTAPRRLVPTMTADAYFASRPPDGRSLVVKIDVEGAELEVLRGFIGTMATARPDIVCEVLPIYDSGNTLRLQMNRAIWDLLRAHGYQIYRLLPAGGAEPVPDVQIHGDLALTNYAFVPGERVETFRRAFC